MSNPMSKKEVYARLLTLLIPMNIFKEQNSVVLKAEQVEVMKEVYESVAVFSGGNLAARLNIGCDSCIREAFQVFISVFDRLAKDPNINPNAERIAAIDAIIEQAPQPTGNGLKGSLNALVETEEYKQLAALNERFEIRKNVLIGLGFELENDIFTHKDLGALEAQLIKHDDDDNFNEGVMSLSERLDEITGGKDELVNILGTSTEMNPDTLDKSEAYIFPGGEGYPDSRQGESKILADDLKPKQGEELEDIYLKQLNSDKIIDIKSTPGVDGARNYEQELIDNPEILEGVRAFGNMLNSPGSVEVPPAIFDPSKEPAKTPLMEGVAINTEKTKTPAQKAAETKAKNKLKGSANS